MSDTTADRKLSIGTVVRRSVELVCAHPGVLVAYVGLGLLAGLVDGLGEVALGAAATAREWLLYVVSIGVSTMVSGVLCGVLASHGALRAEVREASGLQSLFAAVRRAPALLLFSLFYYLVMFAGAVALIVPGLIAATVFSVGGPALVVEKLSPNDAMVRSVALTRGSRWRVFGIIVVGGLFLTILVLMIQGFSGQLTVERPPLLETVLLSLATAHLYDAPMAALTAALYLELRRISTDPGTMAEVFS